MAIEIVDLPINSMVIFHSYVNVYQRVAPFLKVHVILFHLSTDGDSICFLQFIQIQIINSSKDKYRIHI